MSSNSLHDENNHFQTECRNFIAIDDFGRK